MEEKDKTILQNHWTDLTEMYTSPGLLDRILQKKGITLSDYKKLRNVTKMDEQNRCLLLSLMSERNGLNILIDSLLETDNVHIAKLLTESRRTEMGNVRPEQYETLNLMILEKSRTIIGYENKSGQNRRMFHIVGAAAEKAYIVRIYRENDFKKIPVGCACRFENLLKKGDGYLATKVYKLSYIPTFKINKSVKQNIPMLPEDCSKDGVKRNLQEALDSYISLSCIKGIVIQVSPPDFVRDGRLVLKYFNIKDKSGRAMLTLFQENAKMDVKDGDIIEVTNVYNREYKGSLSLSTLGKSRCRKIKDSELESIEINKEDFSREDIFSENKRENVTIETFSEILIYPCCSNTDCRKYKVEHGECPKCKSPWMKQHWCRADFLFIFEDKRQETFRLFQSDITVLLGETVDVSSEEAMINQIVRRLPLKFSCKIINQRITGIVQKRPSSCLDE